MATNTARAQVPLQIKFIDPIRPVKMGRELRFEVLRTDRPERVSFEQLDFAFAPVMWGVVSPGQEPGTGVVKIVALAKSKDVYDRPKYEMTAAYKARGDTSLEAGNLFAVGFGPPTVELKFFVREDDPATEEIEYDEFDPQKQSTPLKSSSIAVDPPGAADVFEEGGRFFARITDPRAKGRITVTFPNGDKASVPLDVRLAGKQPHEIAALAGAPEEPEDADATRMDTSGFDVPSRPGLPQPAAASVLPAARAAIGESSGSSRLLEGEGSYPGRGNPSPTPPAEGSVVGDRTEIDSRPRPAPVEAAASNAAMPSAATMPASSPAKPAAAAPSAQPVGAGSLSGRVDPSYSLRSNMQQLRREIDSALADGLVPTNARARLQQKLAFFRDAAKHYKGPDVVSVQDFFERTLGDVKLEG